MKYQVTRSPVAEPLTFEDTLMAGYSPDGGLYVPESIPQISLREMQTWKDLSYQNLMKRILRLFISEEEIPTDHLHDIIDDAFKKGFDSESIIPVARLSKGLNIAELYHGPTLSFKDLAMSVVGRLLEYFLEKRDKSTVILVGTSGDTGSAAIHTVKDLKRVDIVVLFPEAMCTPIQRLQMITVLNPNVHCFEVQGTSDDLDIPIKRCFDDAEFCSKHNLCCINSINWARIAIQTVHYFYIYLQMFDEVGPRLEFVVPTGAAGNITAGYVAHEMGLPITLVATVNINNIVEQFIMLGEVNPSNGVFSTWATAMDIQMAYNLERLLYFVCDADTEMVVKFAKAYEMKEKSSIPSDVHEKLRKVVIQARSVTDKEIESTIAKCVEEDDYHICPHTATAVAYHYLHNNGINSPCNEDQRVCLATASPAKFPEVMQAAGVDAVPHPKVEVERIPTKFESLIWGQDWTSILRAKIVDISDKLKTDS